MSEKSFYDGVNLALEHIDPASDAAIEAAGRVDVVCFALVTRAAAIYRECEKRGSTKQSWETITSFIMQGIREAEERERKRTSALTLSDE